ncbi:MAG: type II toxin-antitoxin system prevent-host-death family antitoxin [Thermosynechococcaceae cyanobacterium]
MLVSQLFMQIAAGRFKSQCLSLMDRVWQTHEEIVITKRGKPIAKLVPISDASPDSILGFMKDSVRISGDIISPVEEEWEAMK